MQMPYWMVTLWWVCVVAFWAWSGAIAFYINFWVLDDCEFEGGFTSAFLALIGPFGLLVAATGLVGQELRWRADQATRFRLRMLHLKRDIDEQTAITDVSGEHPWVAESAGTIPVLQENRIQLAQKPQGPVRSTVNI